MIINWKNFAINPPKKRGTYWFRLPKIRVGGISTEVIWQAEVEEPNWDAKSQKLNTSFAYIMWNGNKSKYYDRFEWTDQNLNITNPYTKIKLNPCRKCGKVPGVKSFEYDYIIPNHKREDKINWYDDSHPYRSEWFHTNCCTEKVPLHKSLKRMRDTWNYENSLPYKEPVGFWETFKFYFRKV